MVYVKVVQCKQEEFPDAVQYCQILSEDLTLLMT